MHFFCYIQGRIRYSLTREVSHAFHILRLNDQAKLRGNHRIRSKLNGEYLLDGFHISFIKVSSANAASTAQRQFHIMILWSSWLPLEKEISQSPVAVCIILMFAADKKLS